MQDHRGALTSASTAGPAPIQVKSEHAKGEELAPKASFPVPADVIPAGNDPEDVDNGTTPLPESPRKPPHSVDNARIARGVEGDWIVLLPQPDG